LLISSSSLSSEEQAHSNNKRTLAKVSFSKGSEGRGEEEEEVELVSIDALRAIVQNVYEEEEEEVRELLKSASLALRSPRVFWNLAYFFGYNSLSLSFSLFSLFSLSIERLIE
jgi:hypothetical protein